MIDLRVVNFFYKGIKRGTCAFLYVLHDEGSAKSVLAAAVIRRIRALFGFIGFNGSVDGVLCKL